METLTSHHVIRVQDPRGHDAYARLRGAVGRSETGQRDGRHAAHGAEKGLTDTHRQRLDCCGLGLLYSYQSHTEYTGLAHGKRVSIAFS